MKPILSRLEFVQRLRNEFNEPLTLTPMWTSFFAALDDDRYLEYLVSVVRQTGKSTLMAAAASSEGILKPGAYVVLAAASRDQQQAVFYRKIYQPLQRILHEDYRKVLGIKFTRSGFECTKYGTVVEVIATNEQTGTGRTPTLLLIDEARDVADEFYTAMVPSVLGANGKVIIASSAGRPRGFFYELLQNPTEHTWVYQSSTNDNPRARKGVLDFLRRRLALVSPVAARRELGNEFSDDGDSLLPSSLIDAAVDDRLGEMPRSSLPAWCFVDLSRKHDLTSVVVVVRDEPRRPEATDHLVVASMRTWNPRECPGGQIPFPEVRAHITALADRFRGLEAIRVDEGAEAGSVLPHLKADPRTSLIADGFVASVTSNMELWAALAARLHAQTLSIPRDDRLLAELRGLRREAFALGSKWRVVDSSRNLHRDVSVALAGTVMLAGTDDGLPLMVVSDAPGSAWQEHLAKRAPLEPPMPDDDGDDDGEVVEMTDAEMEAAGGEAEWEPVDPDSFLPRAERRKRYHDAVVEIAKRDGYWSPEDAA